MRYGFVIDQDRCIGCHACTVACKEEHQVPVGVFRTWVKYVEKGQFPNTSRHFGVMRCNHCDDSPCTVICPTSALYRRADGIVDFDNRRCIGCKACMQACPYDALYIDPHCNTAAKCNFCAHRVEVSLEPACVIVCPTQAILAGDLDDSTSQVSQIVASRKVSVRKPHKGTQPKLFYKGIEGDLLEPTRMARESTHLWSDRRDGGVASDVVDLAGSMAREVYDVAHPAPWGWKIAAYLWTKSIAAGVLIAVAILAGLVGNTLIPMRPVIAPAISLIFLLATSVLLVVDLKRPDRFFYLLTKPNWKSWLVTGTYVLMAQGALATIWLTVGMVNGVVPPFLQWSASLVSVAAAGYSAFLFAQAKGRDIWQSPIFLWHLLCHALTAGFATVLIAGMVVGNAAEATRVSAFGLLFSLVASLAMIGGELALPHVSQDVALAAQSLLKGVLSQRFWGLAIGAGLIVPIALVGLVLSGVLSGIGLLIAAAFALAGVWWFEDLWIKAGQSVPLS